MTLFISVAQNICILNLRKDIYHGNFNDGTPFRKVKKKGLHYHGFHYILNISDMVKNIQVFGFSASYQVETSTYIL